jgi:two-component system cell cycle sensor histidine kinase/response regulator CckA
VIRPRVIDANSLVGNLATMLRRLLGETITLRISLGKDLPLLFADPAQLEQVIVNLAVNARDAMPRGGELQLRTYRGSALHLPAGQAPGSGVVLEVQDSGVGMSDAVRERLFEPFFTTKTPGRGTGLGLATCQSIVGSTGGEIVVDSLEGEGTTFRLWFPTTEELDEVRTPPVHEAHALAAGGAPQVILLVEDDADVRASTARVLRRAGYDVLDAADGEAALQLMASRTAPVDVVITDIVMPRVGGAELARRLRERWPDLHVLYMSGYPRDSTEVAEVELTGAHVLAKPYTPAILLFELRLRLDATRQA